MTHRWPNFPLLGLLTDRRLWLGPFLWVCVLLTVVNFSVQRMRVNFEASQRANLLLHTTQLPDGSREGAHYDHSAGGDLLRYWPAIPDATQKPLTILCGMSQMHAINEYQSGEKIIAELMDDELASQAMRVFGLSAGNLSNEEALFLLQAAVSSPRTTPRNFIFGVCFDKFRNIDLRPGYRTFLTQNAATAAGWEETAAKAMAAHPLAGAKMQRTLEEIRSESKEVEKQTFEGTLRRRLSVVLPLVAERQGLNAHLQGRLFLFRNWLLRITPTSKRAIIKGRYRMNQEFFREMIQLSRRHGVTLIAYVVPLNPQAENPYLPEQYAEFKRWLEEVCREAEVPFANFEDAVPTEHWGIFLGGPDFKHFKAMGHKLTARAIIDRFGAELRPSPPASATVP